jgi:hypothetical protein
MSEKPFLTAFEAAYESFEVKRQENNEKPNPAVTGSDFAEILLSRQLTMEQQWFLAQFFLGKLHKDIKSGRPKITMYSPIVQAVARHYLARRAMPFKHKKTAIHHEIGERFGLKRSTILNYLKMFGGLNGEGDPWTVEECQEEVLAWEKSK